MEAEKLTERYIARTYKRQPLTLVKGRGMYVWDTRGKKYLDFVGGIAVCALGHSHPALVKAISNQAGKLIHTSNLYYIQKQAELAELLATVTPAEIGKFFFCNSGAEANEGALKLAVKHTKRSRIVAMMGSFHGRTALTVGATWKAQYHEPYRAIIPEAISFIRYNNLGAAESAIDDDTAAVIVEPVQGESGVNIPSDDYLPGLRKICDERGALLICDEVQTGVGRTGKWFACQNWKVGPDIMTMAKALGGGFPIGCMGAKERIMDAFTPGDHASTFGGNPLACSAAIATIKTMKKLKLPEKAAWTGEYFMKRLVELEQRHNCVEDVRGLGLIIGMELDDKGKAEKAVELARARGFLINCTADKVLRFVPPLIVERPQIDRLIAALDGILTEVEK
ncbi:MAG: aspartate aminotransferase family protein [Candidatus Hadarchaeota archaeon]